MAIRTILALAVLTLGSACGGDDEGDIPDAPGGGTIDASGTTFDSAPAVDSTPGIDGAPGIDAGPPLDADLTPDATPNLAPTASFTINPTCTSSNSDPITFTSTSTDPEDDVLTCAWTFNAGNPSSSTLCTQTGVTFPNANPYNCTLEVNDGNGNTDSLQLTIAPCPN